ncbi:MAG: hypothetical protein QX189_02735 [Methylococcales bacterium]
MLTLRLEKSVEQQLKSVASRERKPIEDLLNELVLAYLATQTGVEAKHDINRHAGKLQLSQDPLAFQQMMRDEWQ